MKILKRIFIIIAILIALVVIVLVTILKMVSYRNNHYYKYTKSNMPIENKYTQLGPLNVSYAEFETEDICKKQEVWFPSEIENSEKRYPLIILANGTGVPASKYKEVFKHLASWGFIVVGNEDENSRTGASSALSLDYMLMLNDNNSTEFYEKIDVNNIGISGHSQGGVGAINAVTNQQNGSLYKAMYTASATSSFWGQESQFGTEWSYDVSKVGIPYFMVAGTEYFDAGTATDKTATSGQGICPLWSLKENYNNMLDEMAKIMARRTGVEHGDMLYRADGYMTAWFMYWLKDDKEAKEAFFGTNAEILNNANWQDIFSSL
ncbi:MAG: alpha/beta hydrolase [bacterium]|nr:alpha/beta hydrolase [bacterium]